MDYSPYDVYTYDYDYDPVQYGYPDRDYDDDRRRGYGDYRHRWRYGGYPFYGFKPPCPFGGYGPGFPPYFGYGRFPIYGLFYGGYDPR